MKLPATIPAARNCYWAILKDLYGKLGDDERHELNDSLVGKPRTGDWTLADWRGAVAGLRDIQARRRAADAPDPLPFPLDDGATPKQIAWLRDLVARIAWRADEGHKHLIAHAITKRFGRKSADAWLAAGGLIEGLNTKQAAMAIRVLQRELGYQLKRRRAATDTRRADTAPVPF